MFCPSHTLAGVGVSHGQKQPDDAGCEQNRIEHFILLKLRQAMRFNREFVAIDSDQCCTAEELTPRTYKFEIDLNGRLYKPPI
jgi:hypothetical protein